MVYLYLLFWYIFKESSRDSYVKMAPSLGRQGFIMLVGKFMLALRQQIRSILGRKARGDNVELDR